MQDICPSTAKNDHIYLRVLHDACKTLGGEHQLARHLGVAVEEVERWLKGEAMPPDRVFLACLDLLQVKPRREGQ